MVINSPCFKILVLFNRACNPRVGDEYIMGAGFARVQPPKRGRTFQINNPMLDPAADRKSQLGSLNVRAPAVGRAEQFEDGADVFVQEICVNRECRRQQPGAAI